MDLASRLRSRCEQDLKVRSRPGRSVRDYVRANLDQILEAHKTLPWEAICEEITADGVVWSGTGQPLKAKDLRTLVCRLRRAEGMEPLQRPKTASEPAAKPVPRPAARPAIAAAPAIEASAVSQEEERDDWPLMPRELMDPTPVPAPAVGTRPDVRLGSEKRAKLLAEMSRSTKERAPKDGLRGPASFGSL
ncbi:hypothetical protein WV31_10225 [Magnetospirillum sp. ME-1]|uniref:hypothetical protein n=1 Tax=Magnetospirillum sp. ME-1 TaxID=1639348 RepID=UPI000A17DFEF|nr:hypothetical protein [Magnetospirillum sp. ME-1]ARJ66002.1 hypothetical protein WV31_10225 [Magnetospirillum sp. ME-1]